MLWTLVYDFFVMHIFGGYASNGVLYSAFLHYSYLDNDAILHYGSDTGYFIIKLGFIDQDLSDVYMTLGNYFSLIATIITMVIIVTLCALFIWKIIKLVGGLIR